MSDYSNPKGIIAETYTQLQALELITLARECSPVPSASEDSFLLAVLQASEIAVLNLSDLLTRTILDLSDGRFGVANTKMGWVYGYNVVLTKIASLPGRILTPNRKGSDEGSGGVASLGDSPNFQDFCRVFVDFDTQFLSRYDIIHAEEYGQMIGLRSFDNDFALLLHLLQISNYCTSVWESRLSRLRFVADVASYDDLVHPAMLKDAVVGLDLSGDTFFTQFRGLHQIPEILTREANAHLEHSMRSLRGDDHLACYHHLRKANLLLSVVVDCLDPINVCLSTSDYHDIRENLGLTSGSHSENLHYHLFRDLYPQLCHEFLHRTFGDEFFVQVMQDELSHLHHLIDDWRVKHINFPRNNLGGKGTRSLVGSSDATATVQKMRAKALASDPLAEPASEHGGKEAGATCRETATLGAYIGSPQSLDTAIGEVIGAATQKRFQAVQERTGIFANRPPFVPPPKIQA